MPHHVHSGRATRRPGSGILLALESTPLSGFLLVLVASKTRVTVHVPQPTDSRAAQQMSLMHVPLGRCAKMDIGNNAEMYMLAAPPSFSAVSPEPAIWFTPLQKAGLHCRRWLWLREHRVPNGQQPTGEDILACCGQGGYYHSLGLASSR